MIPDMSQQTPSRQLLYKGYKILHLQPYNIYTIRKPSGETLGGSVISIKEAKKAIDRDPNRLRTLNELFGTDDITS